VIKVSRGRSTGGGSMQTEARLRAVPAEPSSIGRPMPSPNEPAEDTNEHERRRSAMGYEQIRITDELSDSAQRAVGLAPRRHETLGELVRDIARRADLRSEDPVSEQPTRHEVTVDSEVFHTNCFGDALALPFVLRDERFEVRSESPLGGTVEATVTRDGAAASPPEAVVSFGATRVGGGPVQATACPYINAFPSRAVYEQWAAATPAAVTIPLGVADAFALIRDLVSAGPEGGAQPARG
jgi:hypothetical protein